MHSLTYGASGASPNTAGEKVMKVYDNNSWGCYANKFHSKGNLYKLGYYIAHEVLHQLQVYSGFGQTHNNTEPYNLNGDGSIITDSMLPNKRSSVLRPIEAIPADQLEVIQKYLGNK